jgi:hypothetical protein
MTQDKTRWSIEHARTGVIAGVGATVEAAWESAAGRGVTGGSEWQIVPWRTEHTARIMEAA